MYSADTSFHTAIHLLCGCLLVLVNAVIIIGLLCLIIRELWRLPSVRKARVWLSRKLAPIFGNLCQRLPLLTHGNS